MTDALVHARAICSAMTPGEWYESPDGSGASVRAPRAEPVHDTTYVTVANLNDQSLGDALPDEANAAGIVLATAALRVLTDEGTVEKVARVIDPPAWEDRTECQRLAVEYGDIDRESEAALWASAADQKVAPSLAKASAYLTHILELAQGEK